MNDTLTALVPIYGLWLVAAVTLLSCLAVPVPSSLLMVAAGSFAAAGDISLGTTMAAAFAGAIVGDQIGFAIGRRGSRLMIRLQDAGGQRRILYDRAHEFSAKWGGIGVFLSRWLLSPLGPYVNFIGGASGIRWSVFTTAAAAGEAIWVSLYTGLGFIFSDQIDMVADIAGNLSGLLVAAAMAVVLGRIALRFGNRSNKGAKNGS
jgi:membrane-associated protein